MRYSDPTPAYCSSCFGKTHGQVFIDFEAYWDGPVIDEASGIKQAIDDLHLCESCLTAAAEMIGLTNNEQLEERLARLELDLETEKARALKAEAHARQLHGALDTKPEAREKRVFAKA